MVNILKFKISFDTEGADAIGKADVDVLKLDKDVSNLGRRGNGFSNITKGAKDAQRALGLTAQEATNLSFQINDIVGGLATGQSPFTILFQQGPQITQIFGGISATFTRLLPIILRMTPAFVALGAAAAAFRGISLGEQAGKDLNELRLQADEAGVSIKELQRLLAAGAGENVSLKNVVAGYERLKDSALAAREAQKDLADSRDKAIKALGPLNTTAPDFASKIKEVNDQFKGKDIFSKLKISLAGFTGSAGEVEALGQKVAASILVIGDAYKRAELEREAKQAFGEDFVRILKKASSETDGFTKTYENFLKAFDPDKAAQSAKQQQKAADQLAMLRQKMSDAENAVFIPAAQAKDAFLTRVLLNNEQAINGYISFLQSVSTQIQDFFAILQGDTAAASRNPVTTAVVNGLNEIIRILSAAKSQVTDFYNSLGGDAKVGQVFLALAKTISVAFQTIYAAFDKFTAAVNEVFGTNLKTESVVAVAALTRILNPLRVMFAIFVALGQANPFVLMAEGAALLLMYSDRAEQAFTVLGLTIVEKVVGGLREAYLWVKGIAQAAKGDIIGSNKTFDELDALKKAREEIKNERDKWLEKANKYDGIGFVDAFKQRAKEAADKALPALKNVLTNVFDIDAQKMWDGFGKAGDSALTKIGDQATQTGEKIKTAIGGAFSDRADARFAKFVSPATTQAQGGGAFADRGEASYAKFVKPLKDGTTAAQEYKGAVETAYQSLVTIRDPKNLASGTRGAVYKDKAGREGIDNALYPNMKLAIDEIEKPRKIKVDSTELDAAAQKAQKVKQVLPPITVGGATPAAPAAAPVQPQQSPLDQAQAKLQALQTSITNAQTALQSLGTTSMASVGTFAVSVLQQVEAVAQQVKQTLTDVATAASNLKASAPTANGATPKMASGGLVQGPGSGTSDSIIARLSRGEFVVSARSAARFGIGNLHAINSGMSMPGFASGGLVGAAAGVAGASSGGGSLYLSLDSGSTYQGPFSGGSDQIGRLERHAATRRNSATSKRTPSRIA